MKIAYHPDFKEKLNKFPKAVQNKFDKQISFLLQNLRHPSLHAKKYDESSNLWQARVDGNIRFYFFIEKNTYLLINIHKHK